MLRYIGETIAELKKVTWPTRKDATRLTIIVLVVVTATSILLGSLDILFTRIFAIFIS
ncbi:MAG: preprotein translocase subunit SecE [Chloroflexi bacterium]|nr:preprotein translocase subunit SecE [Chloroflexota bacterium]